MLTTKTGAPKDYAELYEHYFETMKSLVRRAGIHVEDVEDVAGEILCKFMEKDALTWFDPDYVTKVGPRARTKGPEERSARFYNLLRAFTQRYCLQWMDKQRNFARREPQFAKLDAPVLRAIGEITGETIPWGEAHQEQWMDVDMEHNVEVHLTLVSAITTAQSRAVQAAELAEDSAQETVWQLRKQAQQAARDAQRHHDGLQAAIRMAESGTRVTGVSLAKACGWPTNVGVTVLKGVRQELRAVGL